ncbi:MAG: peptidoglycan-binding protein [Roseburia sp.]|nr:peptidoglycan-binding protein [Roseburia sp.]
MKRGIDVSDNQGVINWSEVKAAGVEFAILRSTRGSGKMDYQFSSNVKGCRENEIPFDVYKYVYALTPEAAATEIETVCRLLQENNIHCTIWYDIEDKTLRALGSETITRIVRAAETKVKQYGFPFGIYCNQDWYHNVIDSDDFYDCTFWIARYPYAGERTANDVPDESYKPDIKQELFGWQWNSRGKVQGISTHVDLNLIYQEERSGNMQENTGVAVMKNPYPEPTYTLYRGRLAMSEEYVKWLQYYLVQYEYMENTYVLNGNRCNSIDGKFGRLTEIAVENYQKANPQTYTTKLPDKKVGTLTRAALKAELGM